MELHRAGSATNGAPHLVSFYPLINHSCTSNWHTSKIVMSVGRPSLYLFQEFISAMWMCIVLLIKEKVAMAQNKWNLLMYVL